MTVIQINNTLTNRERSPGRGLWNSIAADSAAVPLTAPQRDELDRRLADHAAHPNDVLSWDENQGLAGRTPPLTTQPHLPARCREPRPCPTWPRQATSERLSDVILGERSQRLF